MHQENNNKLVIAGNLYLLMKIGTKQHIENLFYKGEVFMNSIAYYRQCENPAIGDDLEGPSSYYKSGEANIVLKNSTRIPFKFEEIKVRVEQNLNLYCLFGLTRNNLNLIEETQIIKLNRLKDFGEFVCVIRNPVEFIKRVGDKLNSKGYDTWECKSVKYFDNTHQGEINAFMKREIYSYQQEVRFAVENSESGPLKIEIGSIEDIAILLPFDGNGEITIKYRQ